ncbi:MAG: hypothetical protein SCALA702_25360 [Melioribacteraceae bacterium]|nr:MAG: hypothetical protein SCALA702_25360 [Melioribacteraceae bacterium]
MKREIRLSESCVRELIEFAGGLITPERFDKLILMIENEAGNYYFSSGSEANLLRMINGLFDKRSFLSEAVDYPHHIEILVAIAANSNYLTDIIVRNPEYLYQIFDNDYLTKIITREAITLEIGGTLKKFKNFNTRLNFIRLLKRRYLLKIGVNDILGNRTLFETTRALAILANAVCSSVFDLCFEEVKEKNNVSFSQNSYALCSLGKLGGLELNYSSDVDFILFYEKNEVENKKEIFEILTETVHLFVNSCMDKTDRGFLYRVDFRLRPDGRNSPLCRAFGDYMRYYETRGEDWERQMLIKTGFTGGSVELYNKFIKFISSFVYPSSFAVSPVTQIRGMKAKIEKRTGEDKNIKTFAGGIRDIEFSVQALQLINGGKFKSLHTGNSLIALDELEKHQLLTPEEAEVYREAYIFYRRIEHYLQLMNDTQTHVIPVSGELPQKLADYFNFNSVEIFNSKLEEYRKSVRSVYNSIMESGNENDNEISIEQIKFTDNNRAEKNFRFLRTGAGLLGNKNFDSRTIQMFEKIFRVLHNSLQKSFYPDLMLENFSRVISAATFPSIWYHEFQNESFFEKTLQIFEHAQKACDLLVTEKQLGELILSRKTFIKNLSDEFDSFSLKGILFTLSVQFSAGLIDHNTVSAVLQNFIRREIRKEALPLLKKYRFSVISLGSFATGGMTFESDADLVVIASDIERYPNIQEDFQKLLYELKSKLFPFEIDFRLRPEGNKSPLVSDISTFKKYLGGRARIWEFQAFSKISLIAGDLNIYNEFTDAVTSNFKRFSAPEVMGEMREMLKKINADAGSPFSDAINLKKSKGGLVTLDFALHSLILSDPDLYKLLLGKTYEEKVLHLHEVNKITKDLYLNGFKLLKTAEISLQVLFNKAKPNTPTDEAGKKRFAAYVKMISEFDVNVDLRLYMDKIKNEFNKITG